MKKINFNVEIKNLSGAPVKAGNEIMTVGRVISNTLSISKPKNPQTDAIKQYKLALDIYNSKKSLDIEDADFELIKEVLNRNELQYTSLVLGQVFKILEAAEQTKK